MLLYFVEEARFRVKIDGSICWISSYLDGLPIFHIFNFDSVKYLSDLQHDILSLSLVREI